MKCVDNICTYQDSMNCNCIGNILRCAIPNFLSIFLVRGDVIPLRGSLLGS